MSTEKGWVCLVNSRAPALLSHAWQHPFSTNPSGGAHQAPLTPAAIKDFPQTLSSSSSCLTQTCFIIRAEEFDRERDTETYLLPANCFQERGIGKGNGWRAIQHSSTHSRHLWGGEGKRKATPTIQDFNIMKIMPLKDMLAEKAQMSFSWIHNRRNIYRNSAQAQGSAACLRKQDLHFKCPVHILKGCTNWDKLSLLLWIIEVAAILKVS